jgi:maleylacetoacetate isomerase
MTKQAPRLALHGFYYSSAAYRVRIALGLKGLAWRHAGVNLRTGEQRSAAFLAKNPGGLVPALEIGDDKVITQSLAIIDHLDRFQPDPLLVPAVGAERDRVLEISHAIACDIHPLNNLRVLKYLVGPLALSEAQKNAWYAHWIIEGFRTLEALLPDSLHERDGWCVGDAPTMADCCLVPQVANATRMKIDITAFPKLLRTDAFARRHPAFDAAAPQKQPDYVAG